MRKEMSEEEEQAFLEELQTTFIQMQEHEKEARRLAGEISMYSEITQELRAKYDGEILKVHTIRTNILNSQVDVICKMLGIPTLGIKCKTEDVGKVRTIQ